MTKKRFHFGYVCGDTGLIDEEAEDKWFIENCCSCSDLKKNWITVCNKLNELAEENEQLNDSLLSTSKELQYGVKKVQKLAKENEQLKQQKKGQELEIVRLHKLADAMSGVLRELGIYDVYNKEQINNVKKRLDK